MPASKPHILIAEDEKPVAKALSLKLEHEGFAVTIVENGVDALAAIEKDDFSCLVLDLMMPEMDGFEVLSALQEKQITGVPILVASNLAQAEDIARAKDLGADDYYVKSDTPLTVVVERVQKLART